MGEIAAVLVVVTLVTFAAALASLVVMFFYYLAWNGLMHNIFGLPHMSFAVAWLFGVASVVLGLGIRQARHK